MAGICATKRLSIVPGKTIYLASNFSAVWLSLSQKKTLVCDTLLGHHLQFIGASFAILREIEHN